MLGVHCKWSTSATQGRRGRQHLKDKGCCLEEIGVKSKVVMLEFIVPRESILCEVGAVVATSNGTGTDGVF
jgi:hypothetical protein